MAGPQIVPIFQLEPKEGKPQEETFYVPSFELRIKNKKLADPIVQDVIEVVYKDSVNEIDSFDLKINNWDAEKQTFKYVGVPNELGAQKNSPRSELATLFDPGKELSLCMGYKDNMRLMIVGQITSLQTDYPAAGAPTLTVSGLNVLHSFRKAQHTWSWEKKKDHEIAKEIGRLPIKDDRPGLGIRVEVDDRIVNEEVEEDNIFMYNQYDIVFLIERARQHGYSIFLEHDKKGKPFLRYTYADANRIRDVTYILEWGSSLIQFRPTLTTTNQIYQVTVRGWNRRKKEPIVGTCKLDDSGLDINKDQRAVAEAVKGRHEVVTEPVFSKASAEKKAKDILRNQLKEMVNGSGSTVGLPELRAGRKVILKKLGQRFSGEYFVTKTTHTINDSGYRTTFEARREKGLEDEP